MFLRLVDLPAIAMLMMPLLPAWSKLKAVAHTLPYDITIVQDESARQAVRGGPLVRRDDADARDGRRQEPGLDAKRDEGAGRRAAAMRRSARSRARRTWSRLGAGARS